MLKHLFCHAKFFKMNIFFWKNDWLFFGYFFGVCLPKVYLKAPEESDPEDDDDPFRPSASRPMGSTSLRSSKSAKSLRPGGSSGEIIRKDSTCSQHSSRSAWILSEFSRGNGKKTWKTRGFNWFSALLMSFDRSKMPLQFRSRSMYRTQKHVIFHKS